MNITTKISNLRVRPQLGEYGVSEPVPRKRKRDVKFRRDQYISIDNRNKNGDGVT